MTTEEDRWHRAVSQGLMSTWDLRPHHDTVHYAAAWKRQLGFPNVQEADATAFWRCRVHPQDLQPMLAALRAHIEGDCSFYEATFRLRSNGSGYRLMHSRGRAVERDAQGRALRMIGTMVDVTGSPCSPRGGLVADSPGPVILHGGATPFHALLEPGHPASDRVQLLDQLHDLLDLSLRQAQAELLR